MASEWTDIAHAVTITVYFCVQLPCYMPWYIKNITVSLSEEPPLTSSSYNLSVSLHDILLVFLKLGVLNVMYMSFKIEYSTMFYQHTDYLSVSMLIGI